MHPHHRQKSGARAGPARDAVDSSAAAALRSSLRAQRQRRTPRSDRRLAGSLVAPAAGLLGSLVNLGARPEQTLPHNSQRTASCRVARCACTRSSFNRSPASWCARSNFCCHPTARRPESVSVTSCTGDCQVTHHPHRNRMHQWRARRSPQPERTARDHPLARADSRPRAVTRHPTTTNRSAIRSCRHARRRAWQQQGKSRFPPTKSSGAMADPRPATSSAHAPPPSRRASRRPSRPTEPSPQRPSRQGRSASGTQTALEHQVHGRLVPIAGHPSDEGFGTASATRRASASMGWRWRAAAACS